MHGDVNPNTCLFFEHPADDGRREGVLVDFDKPRRDMPGSKVRVGDMVDDEPDDEAADYILYCLQRLYALRRAMRGG